jgi:fumarate hydratase class II
MVDMRLESDSLGVVEVPADKLWGAQTQRSLEHFSIGQDLMPREMIAAYAILKKAAATANHASKRLDDERYGLIVQSCDEILAGQHRDMFPLHVWMTGSGTQFNMNVNEVISNRCCQLAGTPLGSKTPVHPNDHVNMAQSSNDSFPSAMCIAAAVNVKQRLMPAVAALRDAIDAKATEWKDIVKIGRTHMQDATPLTLGQEWSGYAGMLADDLDRLEAALGGVYRLALGGTPVGTGINSAPGFAEAAAAEIAALTHGPAVCDRPQQVHRPEGPRCAGAALRGAAHPGRVPLQDRQRHSLDIVGATRRLRRAADPRKRAGVVDHARHGQPDPVRSARHDRRTGHGR